MNTNNAFFSPRNVSQYLQSPDVFRNQMNRTIQVGGGDGYATVGSKGINDFINGSPKRLINDNSSRDYLPDLSIVGATVYHRKTKPSISVADVMKVNMKYKKPPFGHSAYRSPSNEMLLKKIQYGKSDVDKQKSFLDSQ